MTTTDRPDSERARAAFDEALRTYASCCYYHDTKASEVMYAKVMALLDAARTPLDQPEAVRWEARMVYGEEEGNGASPWKLVDGGETQANSLWLDGYEVRALGVLPFTASPDSVRREALEEAAQEAERRLDVGEVVEIPAAIRALATKGQS